jgi:3-(3-hydroxy-phenyl)propionate hydroxylase
MARSTPERCPASSGRPDHTPQALGQLLRPWTGRADLGGLEIIRTATYTFIGQGLAAGLRDADNLAWKLAHVLTGRAGAGLLAISTRPNAARTPEPW